MRKKIVFVCVMIVVCVACISLGAVFAAQNDSNYFLAGQFFNSARDEASIGTNSNATIVAKYNGEPITATTVEYQKSLNILRSAEVAEKYDTDIEVINSIIENMMILEEAKRLGLAATQAEIDALIQNTVKVYSIPEGKIMMDDYCEGAGITINEYYQLLREQAPDMIAKQKLIDAIGKQYCDENNIEFTKFNPPAEMVEAQEAFVAELFEQNKDKIEYFINVPVVS